MSSAIDQPRNARSRRTEQALLAAARALLEEQGLAATTMAAVADRAGVSRRAVYLHFSSVAALLASLFDYVKQVEDFDASIAPVWAAPDAVTALSEWAAHIARFTPRILPVARAFETVRLDDPHAAAHLKRVGQERYRDCHRVIARLADEGRLAPRWTVDDAADLLLALVSVNVMETLLIERHWSRRRLADHLTAALHATFVAGP